MTSNWKRTKRTVVEYEGIKFDHPTEVEFYRQYRHNGFTRNTQSFTVWTGELSGDTITYTPDFIHEQRKIWIEVKGLKDDLFSLREKLIKEYCQRKGIQYRMVQWDAKLAKFSTEDGIKQRKHDDLLKAQQQLKDLWYLWDERKSLTDDEYKQITHTLLNDNHFSYLRKGIMVKKAKHFTELKRKLKDIKEPWQKLKRLHLEYKQLKTN